MSKSSRKNQYLKNLLLLSIYGLGGKKDDFGNSLRNVGGALVGFGLLASILTGTNIEATEANAQEKLGNENPVEILDTINYDSSESKKITELGQEIVNDLGLEHIAKYSDVTNYSLLFSEMAIPHTTEIFDDIARKEEIDANIRDVFNEYQDDIYKLFLTGVDVSSVPSFLVGMFITPERMMEEAEMLTRNMISNNFDLELNNTGSYFLNDRVYVSEKTTDFELDSTSFDVEYRRYDIPQQSLEIGTNIYTWQSEDLDKLYTMVSVYPKDDLRASVYLESLGDGMEIEKYFDISGEDFNKEIKNFLRNL